jgi:hypothetical protein
MSIPHNNIKNGFTVLQLISTKDTVLYNIQNCKIYFHDNIQSKIFNINHEKYVNRLFCKYYDYDITKSTSLVLWWISIGSFMIMILIFLSVCIHIRVKKYNNKFNNTEYYNFTEVIVHTDNYLL